MIVYWLLLIIGGFLLGGVMFSQAVPKFVLGKDVAASSVDNNPGAFNVFNHCGVKMGAVCLALDFLKGFVPTLIASIFMPKNSFLFTLVMIAPVLGHAVGLFNRFHGGKCVSTAFGVYFGILPVAKLPLITLVTFYIFFSVLVKIKNAAKRSVFVFVLVMIVASPVVGFMGLPFVAVGCALVALVPVVKFLCSKNGLADNKWTKKAN